MTPAETEALNRDYEFLRFEYHFTPDYALLRELLLLGGSWLVSWFLCVWSYDVPDMVYHKRAIARPDSWIDPKEANSVAEFGSCLSNQQGS